MQKQKEKVFLNQKLSSPCNKKDLSIDICKIGLKFNELEVKVLKISLVCKVKYKMRF